jgi:hypothetical protein
MDEPLQNDAQLYPQQGLTDANPATCSAGRTEGSLSSQSCSASSPLYVYALGRIAPRFRTKSGEKEFAQVVGSDNSVRGLPDTQLLYKVLSQRQNRYLVRELCWVMNIEGLETYVLLPRDAADFDLLTESIRARPQPSDLDLVVGVKGPIAPPEVCDGLLLPLVIVDMIYSFDRTSLIKAIPREKREAGKKNSDEDFEMVAEEILDRVMQMADNAGATDEHRALNYLAVRYHRIYEAVALAHARNESLNAVEVLHSRLSGSRKVLDVIFSFTNRGTDVMSKQFIRVDVTEKYPFLVTKLSPYYDR